MTTLIKNNNKIGETNITGYGSHMTILDYKDCRNVLVKFNESGYEKITSYEQFKEGRVKSPYCKSVCHQGYIGEGDYKIKVNGIVSKQYVNWHNMLQRCYNEKFQATRPTYKECIVCDDWLNFQNFAKWHDQNYYEIESNSERGMNLDKDILNKNNKIYCPEYCVYVPDSINLLFIKKNANRGSLPVGVNKAKNSKRYTSHYSNGSKREQIGLFSTVEEAFNAYKIHKEAHIKQVAEEYKNIIPKRLYDALYRYEVEITD